MRWFSHRRSPSPRAATQWYRLLLLAAYNLATAHALLCTVNGDDSAVFRFCFWWPWPLTLTFELGRDLCTMYHTAKFDRPMFSRSEVIVRTKARGYAYAKIEYARVHTYLSKNRIRVWYVSYNALNSPRLIRNVRLPVYYSNLMII